MPAPGLAPGPRAGQSWASSTAERRASRRAAATVDPADLELYVSALVEFLVAGPGRGRHDLDPQVWTLASDMYRRITERAWSGSRRSSEARDLDPPASARLHEVRVPTLVVSGAEDVPAILAVSDILAAGISGATAVRLPGAGHVPALERPAEFNRVLLGFPAALTPSQEPWKAPSDRCPPGRSPSSSASRR